MISVDDTIVAIASSRTPALRGVVRMSGPDSIAIAASLGIDSAGRTSHFRDVRIDVGQPLGEVSARALLWPTPRSYTGQRSVEIHTFGSLPVLQALVNRLIEAGARAARPGEFTLRAFLAGRLDLTQAEAVLGVIDAEDRGSLDRALEQLAGNLSDPMELLRTDLLDLLADVEAGLDFVDEDIEFISDAAIVSRVEAMRAVVATTLDQLAGRVRSRSESVVTLRGVPNVGKSCLINALTGQSAAIVADESGTTRDVLRVATELSGHPVVLVDTAGIEQAEGDQPEDQISQVAQQHAERAGEEASIRVWCVDHSRDDFAETAEALTALAKQNRHHATDLWVATKCDDGRPVAEPFLATSSVTGFGIADLKSRLISILDEQNQNELRSDVGTAARCRGSLIAAESALANAVSHTHTGSGHEYVASELRLAAQALGEVTGAVYTDDILDRVFSRFCIGK